MNDISKYNAVIILILLGGWSSITSQNLITWDKAGNGFWHNKDNWDLGRVPNAMDTVSITHDSVIIAGGEHAQAYKVVLGENMPSGVGLAIFSNASLTIVQDVMDEDVGILIDKASFFNAGLVTIIADVGIDMRAGSLVTNQDSISVTASTTGISNFGEIVNQTNGSILAVGPYLGISNNGPLVNDGKIFVDSCSYTGLLLNFDDLENNGLIHIQNGADIGLDIYRGPLLNSGLVVIDNQNVGIRTRVLQPQIGELINYDSVAILNCHIGLNLFIDSKVTNYAAIYIEDCGVGVENNNGYFLNEGLGKLEIPNSNVPFAAGYRSISTGFLGSGGYLENFGIIQIDTSFEAFENCFECESVNYGYIKISESEFGLQNSGSFVNQAGTIDIISCHRSLTIPLRTFINDQNGSININGSKVVGLHVKTIGTLENRASSSILITESLADPMIVDEGATLDNDGLLTLD